VLDEGEVHEGKEWAAEEVVEVQAEGMGGEFGLNAGTPSAEGLGAVALQLELLHELAVDGLDDLPEGHCQVEHV
jgi:hypothetical protein